MQQSAWAHVELGLYLGKSPRQIGRDEHALAAFRALQARRSHAKVHRRTISIQASSFLFRLILNLIIATFADHASISGRSGSLKIR